LDLGLKSDLVGHYGCNCCEPKVNDSALDHFGNCEPKVDRPGHDYHGSHAPRAALRGRGRDQPEMDHVLDHRGRLDGPANGDPPRFLALEVVQKMGHVVRAVEH
jgi:hypothetical protein